MKTTLHSSQNNFAKEVTLKKLFLIISVILLCFGDSLYADIKPVVTGVGKRFSNARVHAKKTARNLSKAERLATIAAPVISYSSPNVYNAGTPIPVLTPTSSGVAAAAYDNVPANVGSVAGPRNIALDAAGNLFVADYLSGTVKKFFAAGGAPVTLGSGFAHPIGIAVDVAGNVYVADISNTNIKVIPAAGGAPVIIGTGFSNPFSVAVDATGNVFVADYGNKVVKKIPSDGSAVVTIATGFTSVVSVAVDAAGDIYAGDQGNQNIYKIPAAGGVAAVVGTGFSGPNAIAFDGARNMYVTDATNNVVKKMPAGGGPTITIGSGPGIMTGLAVKGDGTIYVADYSNAAIFKFNPVGGYYINSAIPQGLYFDNTTGSISGTPTLNTPATDYTVTAYNSSGSGQATFNVKVNALTIAYNSPVTYVTATAAAPLLPISSGVAAPGYSSTVTTIGFGFSKPRAVAIDAAGNIFIADYVSSVISKIPVGGGPITTIGTGLNGPIGIAVDVAGNVFVADYFNNAIKKIPVGGGATVAVGSGFSHPFAVAVDGLGNIFVADNGNHAMKEIPAGGGAIINLGSFTTPVSVTTDAANNVYFGESSNGVIYKIPASGGPPVILISGVSSPYGLNVDASGNLFIADGISNTIKELPATGFSLITISTAFNAPTGIAADAAGNLIVIDYGNNAVRKMMPIGGYYINALPAGLNFDNATGVLSGTPTTAGPALFYMVTGYNSYGSNSAAISIQVNQLPLPLLSYQTPSKHYAVNYPIPPLVPQSSGVAAPGYSNAPYTLRSGFNNPVGIAVKSDGLVIIAEAGSNLVRAVSPSNPNTFTLGAGFNYPSAVAVDASGNTYVADQLNNSIKKIIGANTTVIASGFNNPTGVAVDASGNVYIADKGNNAVKKIPAGGGAVVTIGSGFNQPTSVAVDSFGNIYIADTGNNAIKMIPAAGGSPVTLGSGFNQPAAIALDASNNIYIADTGNNAIEKMPAGGGEAVVISTAIVHPLGIAVSGTGLVYVTDNINGSIKGISPSGGYYIDKALPAGLTFDNTTGIISGTPITAQPYKNFMITAYNYSGGASDSFSFQVDQFPPPTISYNTPQSFTINTAIPAVTPVSTNVSMFGFDNTPVAVGTGFSLPNGVAVDGAGNVYVADKGNGLVKKIQAVGAATVVIGSGINNPNGVAVDGAGNVYIADSNTDLIYKIPADGSAQVTIDAGLAGPTGLAIDAAGNIYVADNAADAVKKIPVDGSAIISIGQGFSGPTGVAVDAAGNVYVADANNNAIKKILASDGSTVVVSSAFTQPIGIAVDASGNLFVSDFNSSLVKLIPADGSAMVTLGSGFNHPYGVAVDGAGNVYVSDYLNNAIKKIKPTGGFFIAPFLPAGIKFDNNTGTISGKATAGSPATDYTVTGYNVSAGNSAQLNIKVNLIPPPVVNYGASKTYITNIAVTPLAPVVTGVAAPGFSNTPFNFITGDYPVSVTTDAAGNIYYADRFTNTIKKLPVNSNVPVVIGTGLDQITGIAVDAAGNVYAGGYNTPVITKIPAGGGAQVTAGSGFSSPSGIAIDAAGNIFVADQSKNAIYKIPVGGGAPVLIAINLNGAYGVAVDGAGNVYFSSTGNSNVRKVPADGSPIVVVASGLNTPYGVAVDNFGNVFVAENGTKSIKEIPAGGGAIITVASGLGSPTDVSVDAAGNLFVADFSAGAIKKISRSGGYYVNPLLPAGLSIDVATGVITGTPATVSPAANYTVTAYNAAGSSVATVNIKVKAGLAAPNISYATPQILSTGTSAVISPTSTGGVVPGTVYSTVSTLAGSGASGSANGTGSSATFTGLINMAADGAGNIYVADYTGNVIRKITPGGSASTFAGSGVSGNANGTGVSAAFHSPLGIAVDASGNVYVGDSGNNVVRKITPGGVVTTFAGSGAAGNTDGTGTAAEFHSLKGLASDAAGNIYVADFANNEIRKITPGGVVSTFAGNGAAGNANGTGSSATFNGPISLGTDGLGNVYVVDYTGNLIRKITPGAVVSTLAGSGAAGSADGTGSSASFKNPYGVTTDGENNVYVADRSNNKIRKISPAGVVTTLAGSGVAGSGNGTGIAATLNEPRGVAWYQGNLYVADYAGHQVRKVILTGYTISPALPAGLSFDSSTGVITGTPATVSPAANYTVTAYNAAGSDAAIINITIKAMGSMVLAQPAVPFDAPVTADAPVVKQGLSPNGDGKNDVLVIDNIERYPDNKLIIMNSVGSTVYQASGYDNANKVFDGHASNNGTMQKPGTYFYRLEYKDKGTVKYKTGYILIKY